MLKDLVAMTTPKKHVSHPLTVGRLLSGASFSSFNVRFGSASEIAVFGAPGCFSVGLSIGGADLRREKEILRTFHVPGCVMLERSPRLRIQGTVRRALLFRFRARSELLTSLNALKKWSGPQRFIAGAAQVTMLWQGVRLPNRIQS